MPLLQVRECPQSLYDELVFEARRGRRTIAQQALVLIQKGIGAEQSGQERRQSAFDRIKAREIPPSAQRIDPAVLVRDMREARTAETTASASGGKKS